LPCDTTGWGNITIGGDYFFIDDVSIVKAPPSAEIPNVFTPNNDGVNDVFTPKVYNSEDWSMTILNRWGTKIEILNSLNPFWDGSNCQEGVYFYTIKDKEKSIGQGFISLIRD
jgi:gliding motility-associated-like protein